MQGVHGVTGLLECGFLRLNPDCALPPDDRPASARSLAGSVQRYGVDEVQNFLATLDFRVRAGWLPYVAVEKRARENSLMRFCDSGYTHGRFLSLPETIRMSIQICDILKVAHARNIVYRDHKLLHYYWQEEYNGIFVIDWNIAKRHPQGLSKAEKQLDRSARSGCAPHGTHPPGRN
jgi:serine/threonine protein kinase